MPKLSAESLTAFWRRELAGAPLLELPTDRPRATVRDATVQEATARGGGGCGRRTARRGAGLARALEALSHRHGTTLTVTMVAALQTFLQRLSGQDDVVLGLRKAHRLSADFVPIRGRLSGGPAFGELLERTQEKVHAAEAHEGLCFEELLAELWPDGDPERNPLLRWALAVDDDGEPDRLPQGLDAVLSVGRSAEGLKLGITYDAVLFAPTTAERWLQGLGRLLEGLAAEPARRISKLPILSPAEIHLVRVEANDTASSYPRELAVGEIFTARAQEHGAAPALVFGDRTWSYRELEERSNRLAHRLRALGVRRESLVALYMERGGDLVTSMLATLKAGGAYLPLDVSYPKRRLADMLADATPRVLLTDRPPPEALCAGAWRVWAFSGDGDLAGEPATPPPPCNGAEDLAYVIYTSGSTGRPKGAAVVHRAISRLVLHTDYVDFRPEDRVAQASNSSFDAATFEIWGALLNGACLVGVAKETLLSATALAPVLAENAVTTLFLTPALYNQLVAESPTLFSSLRHLVLGGEALDPRAVREALRHGPPGRLVNGYGPTENTTFSTSHRIREVPPAGIPIGRPVAASTAYVVDRAGELLPIGGVGELLLGGDGLARGYLRRPALTAERFVPHPWSREPGGRLYRSGDLVRRLARGEIDFLGRIDHQIKLHGFRIELGEIQAVTEGHPAVRQGVVMARTVAGDDDRQLVAYVVPDTEALRESSADAAGEQEWQDEQVNQWEMVFDDLYVRDAATDDFRFNVVGWEDTATGEPIPAEEMREWLDDTVERILAERPRRVLELGCGTGMLAFAVAPHCELYHGTDLSRQALEYVDAQRRHFEGGLSQLVLEHRSAEALDGFAPGSFDTVIVNSVAQYFPGADYLAQVVEGALRLLAPGGRMFLGDLRSLPLVEPFHLLVALHRAEESSTLAAVLQQARAGVLGEDELLIAPGFFRLLQRSNPRLDRVEIHPKHGWAHNELTRYRYQAILRVATGEEEDTETASWLDWEAEGLRLGTLRSRLTEAAGRRLGISGIPNARLAVPLAVRELADAEGGLTAGEARLRLLDAAGGVEPQALWDLAAEAGYALELSWARHGVDGRFDAFFRDAGAPRRPIAWPAAAEPEPPLSAWTSQPLQGRWSAQLVPELRAHLGERLPEYMVPSRYVLLDSLPINANGKVDRKRLPAPERVRLDLAASYVAPRNAQQERLASIWAEVLGLERVGVEDDFFELGGHSLLATQVISRVRKVFGVDLPLRTLFEAPTVTRMTPLVAVAKSASSLPPIKPLERPGGVPEDDAPLSFAQQRLWFLDRLNPGNPFYVMPMSWSLTGPLDVGVLVTALNEVVRRHETLRTRFLTVEGKARQVISPRETLRVPVADLRGLPAAQAAAQAKRLALRESVLPFDLERELPLRSSVVLRGQDDALLLISLHHVVGDGWSLGVLEEELRDLYRGLVVGRPAAEILGELEIQYADFAVWQRDWLQGERLEEQLAYWRDELRGAPVLELPTDRARPAVKGYRGRHHAVRFGGELSEALETLSQEHGATLYMTLLAAFQALLHRMTGMDDVVVGSPIANRHHAALEALIGFFVNALTMRADLSGDPVFPDLLAQVREKALGAYAHQDLPFDRLVVELSPDRDPGVNPLFQVVFAVQNAPRTVLDLGDVSLRFLELEMRTVRFDLELHVFESPEGLDLSLFYDSDLFDDATIRRLGERYVRVLRSLTRDPRQRASELRLLSAAEEHQALVEWNDTAAAYDDDRGVHELFAAQAKRDPSALAVACGVENLSYGELDRRANRLAHVLTRHGAGPESVVAVLFERSPEMVVSILAVLKAGGAYLPIDPVLPPGRIAFQVADSSAVAVLTRANLRDKLAEVDPDLVLELDDLELDAAPAPAPPPATGPAHLAYVIYTSGSTGRPKGTELLHSGLTNLTRWHQRAYGLGPEHRATMVAGLGFDASVWELWPYLTSGASLHLASPEELGDPARLVAWWRREGITLSFLPTPLAESVLAGPPGDGLALRALLTGGDRLHRAPEGELPFALVNHYGPTECTVVSTWAPVERGTAAPPIGRPLPNTRLYLVDRRLSPVPLGSPGEILLGGASLARGYLGRPRLTAEAFVPDPFGRGERLYRTGDLARQRADGNVDFLGRIDHQVKLRGLRIDLGEIEAVLEEHGSVRQAVVRAYEASRLVAYVVGGEDSVEELRSHLAEKLPEYMVPARYVFLGELPLNPSGKVDRKALPDPGRDLGGEAGFVAPQGEPETQLAALWAEVLGVDEGRLGAEDDFFALGGHSLLATQVFSRVERLFGVELPLRTVFEAPTIRRLAARIAAEEGTRPGPGRKIVRRPPGERRPLSFSQQRMWFLERLMPENPFYVSPVPMHLRGPLDAERLADALREIVRRHEVLRTSFPAEEGEPVPVLRPVPDDVLSIVEVDAEEERLVAEEAFRPFDLAGELPFRFTLFRRGPEDSVLLVAFHHVAADGWSFHVFSRELRALYTGEEALEELAIQYADFAAWQQGELRTGESFARQLDAWRRELAGLETPSLPTDRPRPAISRFRGRDHVRILDAELSRALRERSQERQATLFMTLLSAFHVFLHRLSGAERVVVGTPIANRHHTEIENLIGFFVNNLVLRGDLSQDPSFEDFLEQTKKKALAAYGNQDVPFEKLVEELQPERSLNQNPLFQVMFSLQNAPPLAGDLGEVTLEPAPLAVETARFDLELQAQETPAGLRLHLYYDVDLIDPTTALRWLGHYESLLRHLVEDPACRVSELRWLRAAERHQVRYEWSATGWTSPQGATVHELFEAQVRRTPEATALVTRQERVSYRQLDARAKALAHALKDRGVGAGAVVAVAVERVADAVPALLAILKAGAVYLPLDLSQPRPRRAFMLRDTEARALVSTPERLAELAGDEAAPEHVLALDGREDERPLPTTDPLGPAYVIYTSGTTGLPKGVLIRHGQVVPILRWTIEHFGFHEGSRVLQSLSHVFDFGFMEVLTVLAAGGALYCPEVEERSDAARLAGWIERHDLDAVSSTPALFREITGLGRPLPSLRTVYLAGEPFPPSLVGQIAAVAGPGCRIYNGYGPTETSINSTVLRLPPGALRGSSVPIGRPSGANVLYVVDRRARLVGVGVPGELVIGGVGVGVGYLHRGSLTAEKFFPDPFGEVPGGRLYHSGDLVRTLGDGRLDFLGRIDHQVKIRGFRVELGEIEAALGRHPAVREAVVLARGDAAGERRLAAYVVPAEKVEAAALHDFLLASLPDYMVPRDWVVLDAFPLSPNGKVDRKALPAPERGSLRDAFVAPSTPLEEVLAGIWSELLGVERVGREDDFFHLGGHSLLVTRLQARIRKDLDAELSLPALFERSTLAALAAEVASRRQEAPTAPPIERLGAHGRRPLSFAQQRLWFLDRFDPGTALYNVPFLLRLHGPLDREALAAALADVVRRHEILSTTYAASAEGPTQAVTARPGLLRTDLRGLERPHAAADAFTRRERCRPFDLERGVARFALLCLAKGEHALFVNVHHIAFDAWSEDVFLRDLAAFYEARLRGATPKLPELGVRYADFAAWQRRWLAGPALEDERRYWREALRDLPVLELPTDRPRPAHRRHRGALFEFRLPAELQRRLAKLSRETSTTLFMTLLAAFQLLLSRYAGTRDVAVGTPVANRNRSEIQDVLGLFVNTLALRADLRRDVSFAELLTRTRETTLAAFAHQDFPFEKLVEELEPERQLNQNPLVQVLLVVLSAGREVRELAPGLELRREPLHPGTAKMDLLFFVQEEQDGLAGAVEYDTDLFDATTIHRLTRLWQTLLEAAGSTPERRVSELALQGAAERHQTLVEWNDTAAAHGARSVHQVFEDLLGRYAEREAIVFGERRLSYRELNARANRLAHLLRDAGLGGDEGVAISMRRSPEAMVAVLGTLKAGGFCVPLDPAYPAERRRFMLADAAVKIVLTDAGSREGLEETGALVVTLDAAESATGHLPAEDPPPVTRLDHLIYLIYTSGSTGRPKGVALPHRAFATLVPWHLAHHLGGARTLQFASLSFDISYYETFTCWLSGGTLVLIDEELRRDVLALARFLDEARIEKATFPVVVLEQLAQLVGDGHAAWPRALAEVTSTGEQMRVNDTVRAFFARRPEVAVHNHYGPSEAHVVTAHALGPRPAGWPSHPPVGRPVDNTRIVLADARLVPVPAGASGELLIGGAQLARGYLGRPALTAERFVPDPTSTAPGERLYRSGDLARAFAGGTVEYQGRLDHQVKIRGYRIELGEVESVLERHPAVEQALATAREDESGEPRLTAYVVGSGPAVEASELRRFLQGSLPLYMVPEDWVFLEAFPLSPNRKVDLRALPAPERRGVSDDDFVAPASPLAKLVAGIWNELLGVERTGLRDNFFGLGGHSLLATRLISRLDSELDVDLGVSLVFETADLGELVDAVEAALLERPEGRELLAFLTQVDGLTREEGEALLETS